MDQNNQTFKVLSKEELLERIRVREKAIRNYTHNEPRDENEISEKPDPSSIELPDTKSNLKVTNSSRKRSQKDFLDILERRNTKRKKLGEKDDNPDTMLTDTIYEDPKTEDNATVPIENPVSCEDKAPLKAPLISLMQEVIPVPPTLSHPHEVTSLPLPQFIRSILARNSIIHLFPIQSYLLPSLLTSPLPPLFLTASSLIPSDVCVSAPTGSGKTLCYLLPILSRLHSRVVPRLRALIVLPTKDLANQIHSVFVQYTKKSDLRVLILSKDTHALLTHSTPDVLISTPGRLVDSLNSQLNLSLEYLEFLVVDEADRLLDQSYHEWIPSLLSRIPSHPRSRLSSDISLSVHCRKLLFSATLTRSPERLSQLDLYRPVLYCIESTDTPLHKYTLPPNLHQTVYTCTSTQDKPLLLYHLLSTQKSFTSVLCFTNSKDNTRRLYLFLSKLGFSVNEFSSLLNEKQRKNIFHKFSTNQIDILICTDTMARGIDIQNVNNIINYDCPPFLRNYVHRVGRTARALQEGNAYTLLEKCEVYHFKKMMKGIFCEYGWKRVTSRTLSPYKEKCSNALDAIQTELQDS